MATSKDILSVNDRPRQQTESLEIEYGSDVVAEQLSRLNIDYFALVPGSSFRGLHDSIVNFKGNKNPQMIVTLHEEHAVAIAHGYAKVVGKPMAVGVHANVGLMHATMAVYNAFTDRVPVLILGATGPLDATRRRPWIDWIHTAQDQGALVRNYVKFDDQPHSPSAAMASLIHAYVAAQSKPCAPTYVCLDVGLQEDAVEASAIEFPDTQRYLDAIDTPGPSSDVVSQIVRALDAAKKPLFMFGRTGTSRASWQQRIALAEKFDARVSTDLKQIAAFPTHHRLHASPPAVFLAPETSALIRAADLILSFDWVDLAGSLKAAVWSGPATVIHVSLDAALHNGWSKDHFALPPADMVVRADVDETVAAVLRAVDARPDRASGWPPASDRACGLPPASPVESDDIFMPDLARALYSAVSPDEICLVRVPLGWVGRDLRTTHPLSFLGMDGGAGIASGPGLLVGAALGIQSRPHHNPPLLPVGILGDGDFLMGSSALWTATHHRLPLLCIVANNGGYYNDEVHQATVASHRRRPVANKSIGVRLEAPRPHLGRIAEGLGCAVVGTGRVARRAELDAAVREAVGRVRAGAVVVLDVCVLPEGDGVAVGE